MNQNSSYKDDDDDHDNVDDDDVECRVTAPLIAMRDVAGFTQQPAGSSR